MYVSYIVRFALGQAVELWTLKSLIISKIF